MARTVNFNWFYINGDCTVNTLPSINLEILIDGVVSSYSNNYTIDCSQNINDQIRAKHPTLEPTDIIYINGVLYTSGTTNSTDYTLIVIGAAFLFSTYIILKNRK